MTRDFLSVLPPLRKFRSTSYLLLLGVEILLIAYCLLQYTRPLHRYLYQGDDLSGQHCLYLTSENSGQTGCYLDISQITDSSVDPSLLYITTPYTDLPKGSYRVTIAYDMDSEGHKYSVTSKFRTYPVIVGHEEKKLPADTNEASFSFFSPIRVDEYQVHVDYSGSGHLLVESIHICETNAWKNILLFYVVLFSLLLDAALLFYRCCPVETRRETRVTMALLLFLALFTSAPLFTYFMPSGKDLPFHMSRIEAIRESFLAGQFPNRISSWWNRGYGYASAIFYGELFLYVPALLRILGFSVQHAYKFYTVAVNLGTVLVSYVCFRKCFRDRNASLFGCAAYVLAPHRLVSIYLRTAVGESTAMLFFPLIFYGLYRICAEDTEDPDYKNGWITALLGYTGIIQCHIISCVMAGIFTGLFLLCFLRRFFQPKRFLQLFKLGVGFIMLNLWFLLPFVDYFRVGFAATTQGSLGRFQSSGAYVSQLLSFFQQGYGNSYSTSEALTHELGPDRNHAMGALVLVMLLYLCCRLYQGKSRLRITQIGDFCTSFAVIALFMCTLWFPWDFIQQQNGLFRMITRNIQFPWRFLGISSFFLAVTAVCLMLLLKRLADRTLYHSVTAALCALFLLSAWYFMDDYIKNAEPGIYLDEADLNSCAVGMGEYLPENTPEAFFADTAAIPGPDIVLTQDSRQSDTHFIRCSNSADDDSYVDIPFLPYKGYVCTDSDTGRRMEVRLDTPGRVRVIVPAHYNGTFSVTFQEPWYWRVAELISLCTLLGLGVFAFRKTRSVLISLN